MRDLRADCEYIVDYAIKQVLPAEAVNRTLQHFKSPKGKLIAVAIGKAAYSMAQEAYNVLGDTIDFGIVVTKHGHAMGQIPGFEIYEAGHPLPDQDTFDATERVLEVTRDLSEEDEVLFLVSGGGSALFEKSVLSIDELEQLTDQMLRSGANIKEINTIRKRFSLVKGGRFAVHCMPAKIYSIILSDVVGDPLDVIASGPAYPDSSTHEEAYDIIKKYKLAIPEEAFEELSRETITELSNVETVIAGNVTGLCRAAAEACKKLGYETSILTSELTCEASEAALLAVDAAKYAVENKSVPSAYILGGETTVHVTGDGLGGRNQEIALSAAIGIQDLEGVAVFSVGSDGTDGPTDAAGGYVDYNTVSIMEKMGISIYKYLNNHDSYHCLDSVGQLIKTGPTGTNVNDVTVVLVDR